jgi:hypothetical protein
MNKPSAADHAFARLIAESGMDEVVEHVRLAVKQYQRGLLTERDLLRVLATVDPNEGELR